MANKKKRALIAAAAVCALSCTIAPIIAFAGGGSFFRGDDASEEYEKPSVNDITGDGAYPDEKESSASAEAGEKKWYEYVVYSKNPYSEMDLGNYKICFYDPYDYNYGTVMEISNPESNFGEFYDPEGYTTANEISVSYTTSKSSSWSHGWSVDLGFEESVEAGALIAKTEVSFSQNLGYNGSWTGSSDSEVSKSVTYNAIYHNANGTPYRWRIVKYTVKLPIYCQVMQLINGEWVVIEDNYLLLTTVEGTCREWIDNTAKIEDWRTGEAVEVTDFWDQYLSPDAIIDIFKGKLMPVKEG